jgi:hypothetical protein
MNSTRNFRMQIPAQLAEDIHEVLKRNNIPAKEISDKGGLRDVMSYLNITVGLTNLVLFGLQVYEFLRDIKKKTGKSHVIKIEAPDRSNQSLCVEIDAGKAKPIIKIQLENMQKELEQNQ